MKILKNLICFNFFLKKTLNLHISHQRLEIERHGQTFGNHMYCQCSSKTFFNILKILKIKKKFRKKLFENTKLNYCGNALWLCTASKTG